MKEHYTDKEVLWLRLLFEQGHSDTEIAAILERTASGIQSKRQTLRLLRPTCVDIKRKKAHRWTKDEEEFILNYWYTKTDEWMAAKLKVSVAAYKYKRKSMNTYANGKKRRLVKDWTQKKGRHTSWTFNQEQFLIERYPTHSSADIARYLGRNPAAIIKKANTMGLKKEYFPGKRGYPPIEQYYDENTFTPTLIN